MLLGRGISCAARLIETRTGIARAAGPMVDALRLSTLPNRLRRRVDKARRTVLGAGQVGCARRIHQGPRDAAQV